jgi:hypothetical protein
MDLLDMLNDDSEPVEEAAEEVPVLEKAAEFELKENEAQKKASDDEGAWLDGFNNGNDGTKKARGQNKAEMLAELHQTKIKEGVDADRFVWAPNQWYAPKGGKDGSKKASNAHNFFPARIVDNAEAMRIPHEWNPDPTPADALVVEYISAPRSGHGRFSGQLPKYVAVTKNMTVPYNENIHKAKAGGKAQRQMTLMETGNLAYKGTESKDKWHKDGDTNLSHFLGHHHPAEKAILFHDAIMKKAQQYLDKAFDPDVASDTEADDSDEEGTATQDTGQDGNETDSSDDEALTSLVDQNQNSAEKGKKNRKVELKPGDWVSYINKMFGRVTHTRIVEIKAAVDSDGKACTCRLVVENGDVLKRSDDIRRMEKVESGPEKGACDKRNGSSYILVKDFRMKVGVDKTLTTIHQAASAMSKQNKIDLTKKLGPTTSEKKRKRDAGFIDTQSDEEDEDEDEGEEGTGAGGVGTPKAAITSSTSTSTSTSTSSTSGTGSQPVSVVSRPSSQAGSSTSGGGASGASVAKKRGLSALESSDSEDEQEQAAKAARSDKTLSLLSDSDDSLL